MAAAKSTRSTSAARRDRTLIPAKLELLELLAGSDVLGCSVDTRPPKQMVETGSRSATWPAVPSGHRTTLPLGLGRG